MYSRKGSAVKKKYTRLTCKNKKGNFTILGATFSRGSGSWANFWWRALCEPAHYSLRWREKAKICRMQDQKHAQSIGFLIIRGIHSSALISRKTYVDEIERFGVNFQSANISQTMWVRSYWFYSFSRCLYSNCLRKYSLRSRSRVFCDESRGSRGTQRHFPPEYIKNTF